MQLTERELATVLSALRYWQQDLDQQDPDLDEDAGPISPNFKKHEPLTSEKIDRLCERLEAESGICE
jgi:hypothetical protein